VAVAVSAILLRTSAQVVRAEVDAAEIHRKQQAPQAQQTQVVLVVVVIVQEGTVALVL
jgi:hypothetical protein